MIDPDKCRITHYPASVLANRARPVEEIDDTIRKLVDKMIEIMIGKKGIGLAAPQAGVPLRLFVISLDGSAENATRLTSRSTRRSMVGERRPPRPNSPWRKQAIRGGRLDVTAVETAPMWVQNKDGERWGFEILAYFWS